tara:strand:- start:132 stop:500 length:369 start_codon:yes stop_codon:yes gene_type:complete
MNNTNIIITLIIVYLFYYNITIDNQKYIEINMIFMLQIEQSNKNIIKYDRQIEQSNKNIIKYHKQIEQSNNIMKTLEEHRKQFLREAIEYDTGRKDEDFHSYMRKHNVEHLLSETQIQDRNR